MGTGGNAVFTGVGTTIFEVMSRLAAEHGAINLGQGFPDGNGPDDVRAVAQAALADRPNQYPSMLGVPELRGAVADHAQRFYGLALDPAREVLVTSGATEALASCLFGLLETGDEVVLIEPLYDSYLPIVRRAGAIPKLVRLQPPGWTLPRADLAAAFSSRTKLLVLNSPMNPTGKVFDGEELAFIADLLHEHDAWAVCDEVYEHLVYDGRRHVPLMTLPGMRNRCLRIGSAGKTFSLTGWKVGYVAGAPDLLGPVIRAHQFLTFTTPPNLQRAVAYGLAKDEGYFTGLAADLQTKRDLLAAALSRVGLSVFPTAGTYFLCADATALLRGQDDTALCERLVTEAGVAAIPISAFYAADPPRSLLRFAFCKDHAVIADAAHRLSSWLTAQRELA